MFRLIKLALYATVGYVLYELYQGMVSQSGSSRGPGQFGGSGGRELNRALNRDGGRMETLTGPGEGTRVDTLDSDGASQAHRVGRGVVSR
jgi:hypothetical protein